MPLPLPEWLTPKRARILFIIVACIAALPLLVVEENIRGKSAYEHYRRELEAKGEHLDIASFLGPQVPDDQNFAKAPALQPLFDGTFNPVTLDFDYKDPSAIPLNISINAVPHAAVTGTYPNAKGSWQNGQVRDLEGMQKYYRAVLPSLALVKSPAEDVLGALAQYDGYLADLRKADATMPLSRFPVKFDGPGTNLNWYGALQRTEGVLALRAVAELRLGRAGDALADVKLGFRLVDSIRNTPTLIGGLVRLTMMSMLMQPVWEGIASHAWTADQLTQLDALLQREDFLADFASTIRGERAWSAAMWDANRSNPAMAEGAAEVMGGFAGKGAADLIRAAGSVMRVFTAITWQNETYQFRFLQDKILPLVDVKARRVDVPAARALQSESAGVNPYNVLARMGTPVYPSIVKKYALAQTFIDEARVACAIERYRMANNALPAKLDDLHMPGMPRDVIDGNPLRYLIMGADDYRLYSIGWNETDDGGAPGRSASSDRVDPDTGDWVWSLKPF